MIRTAKLLVVTPTLGRSEFLCETIQSVGAIPLEKLHLIIAPQERINELKCFEHSCVIVPQPSDCQGMYGAINHAISVAAPEDWTHFTYINDDDILLGTAVDHWAAVGKNQSSSHVLYGRVEIIDKRSASELPCDV